MGWDYFLKMGEWKDFGKASRMSHSHPFEKEKNSTSEATAHTMGLSERDFFFSHKMEA
jgi:hypothetical protein